MSHCVGTDQGCYWDVKQIFFGSFAQERLLTRNETANISEITHKTHFELTVSFFSRIFHKMISFVTLDNTRYEKYTVYTDCEIWNSKYRYFIWKWWFFRVFFCGIRWWHLPWRILWHRSRAVNELRQRKFNSRLSFRVCSTLARNEKKPRGCRPSKNNETFHTSVVWNFHTKVLRNIFSQLSQRESDSESFESILI